MGVPPNHHPFIDWDFMGFSLRNHPAMGVPPWKPPYLHPPLGHVRHVQPSRLQAPCAAPPGSLALSPRDLPSAHFASVAARPVPRWWLRAIWGS